MPYRARASPLTLATPRSVRPPPRCPLSLAPQPSASVPRSVSGCVFHAHAPTVKSVAPSPHLRLLALAPPERVRPWHRPATQPPTGVPAKGSGHATASRRRRKSRWRRVQVQSPFGAFPSPAAPPPWRPSLRLRVCPSSPSLHPSTSPARFGVRVALRRAALSRAARLAWRVALACWKLRLACGAWRVASRASRVALGVLQVALRALRLACCKSRFARRGLRRAQRCRRAAQRRRHALRLARGKTELARRPVVARRSDFACKVKLAQLFAKLANDRNLTRIWDRKLCCRSTLGRHAARVEPGRRSDGRAWVGRGRETAKRGDGARVSYERASALGLAAFA
jgi:hypothetical protein